MYELEKRNEINELRILRIAFPGREDYGILRLSRDMRWLGVKDYDLGEIPIEITQILQSDEVRLASASSAQQRDIQFITLAAGDRHRATHLNNLAILVLGGLPI